MLKVWIGLIALCISMTNLVAEPVNIGVPLVLKQNAFLDQGVHPNVPLLSPAEQRQQHQYFKKQYFEPWSPNTVQTTFCFVPGNAGTCQSSKQTESETLAYYVSQPKRFYDSHYQLLNPGWTAPIANNMQLDTFPNIACTQQGGCRGILVDNVQLRSLPTNIEAFRNFLSPGEGYPFDYLQLSNLWIGTPVQMLQLSKDREWLLIKGQGVMGWVPAQAVAKVTRGFIRYWTHHHLFTMTTRQQTVHVGQSAHRLLLGSLLIRHGYHHMAIPVRDDSGYAKLAVVATSGLAIAPWPLIATPKKFAQQINALLGMPYGWGGKDFHSDCSGTLRRLFITFGIWLPRSSVLQANYSGSQVSLIGQTPAERKAMLEGDDTVKPTPFLTLIGFGHSAKSTSHIGLYLGTTQVNGKKMAVMFNELWGVKVLQGTQSGRAWIGQAALTPIGVGENIAPALAQAGWQLDSLWNAANMSLTTIGTKRPSSVYALSDMPMQEFVKQYLFEE